MVMIYDDYITFTDTYQAKYGPLTVIFMQVGDFFELYAVNNDTEKVGADIYTVCDLCNIQVSRKNKTIIENSRQNPLMAGFPISIINKHTQTLVSHNYTVVVIRQVTPPPNPKREVTEIISPATNAQTHGHDNTFLMVLYWEHASNGMLAVGMSTVDITTGDVHVAEAYPRTTDGAYAKDEAFRWIQSIQPKEVILIGDGSLGAESIADIEQHLQINHLRLHRTVHDRWQDARMPTFKQLSYQTTLMNKLYPGCVSVIEECDLERKELIRIAFTYGIEFIFEHDESMVECLKRPVVLFPENALNVNYNGLLQLNALSHTPGEKPLIAILNRCSTAFGSRLFKEKLFNPVRDPEVLQNRYDTVEWFVHMATDVPALRKYLSSILDLERLSRRLMMENLSPCEWSSITSSLESAIKVFELLKTRMRNKPGALAYLSESFDCMMESSNHILRIVNEYLVNDEACKYWMNDIRGNIFQRGVHSEIDELSDSIDNNHLAMQSIANAITALGGPTDTCLCKVDSNDRDGYFLSTTKKRWTTALGKGIPPICSISSAGHDNDWKVKPISASSTSVRVTSPILDKLSDTIVAEQRRLMAMMTTSYVAFMKDHKHDICLKLQTIVQGLAELDVYVTNARNALEFCYCKPVMNLGMTKSYIDAKQMRHPIIERIQSQTSHFAYVPNDIRIGMKMSDAAEDKNDDEDEDGWLLYGINASGKSSMMKAIGLNVLMAQAGMFVPCESFVYKPYEYIFTRISGADNIYRGMSSFTVEMMELKNILLRCTENSLVLGDEVCAGTEGVSAVSIVAAGIEFLASKGCTFVFATHLHELLDIDCVPKNVAIYHIHIDIDEETGKIIYDRSLSRGPGHAFYGLEVCKALRLPSGFMKRAHFFRRTFQKASTTFVNAKHSAYNRKMFMDKCTVCGKTASVALETHHIKYQQHASSTNHVAHVHAHALANLVTLCEECHKKEHNNTLHIEGYVQTSEGAQLNVRRP